MEKLPVITADTIKSSVQSYMGDPEQYTKDAWDKMIEDNPEVKLVVQYLFGTNKNRFFQDGYLKGFVQCYTLMRRQAESDEMAEWLK